MKNIIYLIIASLFAISCASTQAYKHQPSSSMCLDALKANMKSAGCEIVSFKRIHPFATEITCEKKAEETKNEWLDSVFVAMKQRLQITGDLKPLCGDPSVILVKRIND